jgi:hypothetical protein
MVMLIIIRSKRWLNFSAKVAGLNLRASDSSVNIVSPPFARNAYFKTDKFGVRGHEFDDYINH